MKLSVYPYSDDKPFEVKIRKESSGVFNYYMDDAKWRGFQFDCYDRPNQYLKEFRHTITFHGFLISKTKDGNREVLECNVKIIYE